MHSFMVRTANGFQSYNNRYSAILLALIPFGRILTRLEQAASRDSLAMPGGYHSRPLSLSSTTMAPMGFYGLFERWKYMSNRTKVIL